MLVSDALLAVISNMEVGSIKKAGPVTIEVVGAGRIRVTVEGLEPREYSRLAPEPVINQVIFDQAP